MSAPYTSYKNSGADWIGRVPSHWDVDRFKWSISSCRNGIWGEEADGGEDDLICVRVADFDRTRRRVVLDDPTLRKVTESERSGRLVRRGNLLIEKSGGGEGQPVGAVVLYDHQAPAVCSNFVARIDLAPDMWPEFWVYVHAAAYAVGVTTRSIKQTSGTQNLDQSQYLDEVAPYPPFAEQQAIAAFLDRETGKIDRLVEEQRRLITLLREKRQAVISHAVTKGLDPDAPMKPSGVDWLGDIPAHWEVKRVKHQCSHVVDCLHTTPTYDGELLYPAIRTADVDVGRLNLSEARLVSKDVYEERIVRLKPEPNDILYSREGERFGMAALVPLGVKLCLGQRMMMFRASDRTDAAYLMWTLNSQPIYQQVLRLNTKTTSPHVNIGDVINFYVPCPTREEQVEIAAMISAEVATLDELAEEVEGLAMLLQERRAALISAAVTGKIDVREQVAEATEAA